MRLTRAKLRRITKDTSEWSPFRRLWATYSLLAQTINGAESGFDLAIDPFARNCNWAYPMTNDINPETRANYNLDAEDFLKIAEAGETRYWIGLLDPPFSDRQSKDKYGTSNLYAADGAKMKRIQMSLGRCIHPGGYIIKAGYNTNRPSPAFSLVEVAMVSLGGNRNDVLFSVWQKTQHEIFNWGEQE